jgi:hypothetical protein
MAAMFCKRLSDDLDWYDHVHPGTNFFATSLKFTVRTNDDGLHIIHAPAIDATMLFPESAQVIEMTGDYNSYSTDELIEMFAGKAINLETGEITPVARKQAPDPVMEALQSIMHRLDALEKKL